MPRHSYQQVADLIEHVRAMHRKVREAVSERVGDTEHERTELLLRLIEEHDKYLETALANAGGSANGEAVLNTWLQYTPNNVAAEAFRELDEVDELDDEELVDKVLRAEAALVQLYRILAGSMASAPRVQSFFQSLLDLEDAAGRRYARAQLEDTDV